MIRQLICWIFGHRWDADVGLYEGIYKICSRCHLRGEKIADWEN